MKWNDVRGKLLPKHWPPEKTDLLEADFTDSIAHVRNIVVDKLENGILNCCKNQAFF